MKATSIRNELIEELKQEAEYCSGPRIFHPGHANWCTAMVETLETGEMFGGPPIDIDGTSMRAREVLERWRRMHGRLCRIKARRAMGELRSVS